MSRSEDPPSGDLLTGLTADDWAVLLTHLREALTEVGDDDRHPDRSVIRALPTGRIAGGKGRDRAAALIASDPALWRAVRTRLTGDPQGAEVLATLEDTGSLSPGTDVGDRSSPSPRGRARDQALVEAKRRSQRDRERLKEVRAQRDDARRRADLAERRARGLEEELEETKERVGVLEGQVARLNGEVAAADRERERAVQRERRRAESDVAAIREELAQLRRDEERRRERDRRRVDRERSAASQRAASERRGAASAARDLASTRLVPGRPSELPAGVQPGTREAVELYLHRGRRVLIDGYNVTLKKHGHLELEQQRTWLVGAVANLARARGIRPTVVFDGGRSGAHRGGSSAREVVVRFSDPGITADDEIVLEVEATDDPIVVVTDDRELSARVRAVGADVIGSHQLLWVL